MRSGKVIYTVTAWVPPEVEQEYLDWLDGGHIEEVIAQPGFVAARRVRLNQSNAEGALGLLTIYELHSAAALDAYLASETRQRLMAEGAAKFPSVRTERLDGKVEYSA